MNVQKDEIRGAVDGAEPPELVEAVLRHSTASDSFRERCEDAALAGLAMVKLRKQRQKTGFKSIRFRHYIDRLAGSARTSIDGLTQYYKIAGVDFTSDVHGMLRFAYDLGLPLRESVVLIKAEAAELASLPMALAASPRGGSRETSLRELELAIHELLRSQPERVAETFQRIDETANEVYQR